MNARCENCKHFKEWPGSPHEKDRGSCTLLGEGNLVGSDMLRDISVYDDSMPITVGRHFGCVRFEKED